MGTPLKKKTFHLPGIFSPKSPLEFLGFSTMSGICGLLSAGNSFAFGFVLIFALLWWIFNRYRDRKLKEDTGFVLTKEEPKPAKGLVLLMSPYNPGDKALQAPQVLTPLIDSLLTMEETTEADFDCIRLWQSNLVPQIRAVDYHFQQGELRDVWLIATESYESVRGSETAAAILEKYVNTLFGSSTLTIHREGFTLREYDYKRLWELGEQIFRNSGYHNDVVVADITGGNKMMSVAIAMACIPPGRRMQYMDSQRDWQGNPLPKGEMRPVVIDIDSILYQDNGQN